MPVRTSMPSSAPRNTDWSSGESDRPRSRRAKSRSSKKTTPGLGSENNSLIAADGLFDIRAAR